MNNKHCLLRCCLWACLISLQAQSRPTYYAPNQMAQMRPNPRWQQGGRPQGECPGDCFGCMALWVVLSDKNNACFPFFAQLQLASWNWLAWLTGQFWFEDFLSFLPSGFQGMPNAMRQSGPRPVLRHLAPAGTAPASRGLPVSAQRVGKVSASQALLSCGGWGCYWDLTLLPKVVVRNR